MQNKKILFGICGSFCNHMYILDEIKKLSVHNDIQIVVSNNVYELDTRFYKAEDFIKKLEYYTNKKVWHSLVEAEKAGPIYNFDIMIIAPITSTCISKLRNGIYDNPVLLAAKAHLRNDGIVVIGASSNDLLSISASNFFSLINFKNIYSLPFYQDDPYGKPHSLVSVWEKLEETLEYAIHGKQIQPLFLGKKEVVK